MILPLELVDKILMMRGSHPLATIMSHACEEFSYVEGKKLRPSKCDCCVNPFMECFWNCTPTVYRFIDFFNEKWLMLPKYDIQRMKRFKHPLKVMFKESSTFSNWHRYYRKKETFFTYWQRLHMDNDDSP